MRYVAKHDRVGCECVRCQYAWLLRRLHVLENEVLPMFVTHQVRKRSITKRVGREGHRNVVWFACRLWRGKHALRACVPIGPFHQEFTHTRTR